MLQMGSKLDPHGIQMGPKWDPNGTQMGSEWDPNFPIATMLPKSRSYLVVTVVTSICYKWLQKFQLQQKFQELLSSDVNMLQIASKVSIATSFLKAFNPISTGQGRNQPLYERCMTKSGRNRVKTVSGVFEDLKFKISEGSDQN